MSSEIATAIIALTGVLVSVIVSLLSVNRRLKIEKSKIDSEIELLYISEINKRRLEAYPEIYETISVFLRSIVLETITKTEFDDFFTTVSNLNTKHSLLFSYETGNKFNGLWKFYFKEYQGEIPEKSTEEMDRLVDSLSQLKISLKKEVGIYLLEFRDPQRNLDFNSYDEIKMLRNRKKK